MDLPIRTLMGPGPSDVHPRVLAAMAKPTIGHLDPKFVELMDRIKSQLRDAFMTSNPMTFPVSAPGSAGMETCFVNLVEPGDVVVVCQNGVFGARMLENVKRLGGLPVVVEAEWGKAIDLQAVEDALKAHPEAKIVAGVHAETSTGVLSNVKGLAELAKRHDCLSIIDTVTSFCGSELYVDGWGLDAVYAGTQKCLSAPPGLSPITFSERALAKVKARKTPVQSWFMDLNLVMGYWQDGGKRSYHHTAPVNSLYALHEALNLVLAEGMESVWQRHKRNHEILKSGLKKLGLEFFVAEKDQIPQLNAVVVPSGVDEAKIRATLLNEYNIEIGAGLGPMSGKIWRIGLMGYSNCEKNVAYLLSTLEKLL